jgi:hypothetical protein
VIIYGHRRVNMIDKNSKFYIQAKKMLDEYVAAGGNVEDLGVGDKIYKYIKDAKVKDENGEYMGVEAKFELLEHPRLGKRNKDLRQKLIKEVVSYRQSGNSFHIERKKLPFYNTLYTYSRSLKLQGITMSHDKIMKGLGFKEYSDVYYRCIDLFELSKYRDEDGFVDSYKKNEKLKAYVASLARHLEIPYYLVVTLLANENLKNCYIATEYVSYVKSALQQYYLKNGSLKGLKSNDETLYYQFDTLIKYYADDNGTLDREDWLEVFEINSNDSGFKKTIKETVDVSPIMSDLKRKFGDSVITAKDIDSKIYRKITVAAAKQGVPLQELFRNYGINYRGSTTDRLSRVQVTQIPYLREMREYCDKLLEVNGYTMENGCCKEEIFEARVKACKQTYNKFKDQMFNFTIDNEECVEGEKLDL